MIVFKNYFRILKKQKWIIIMYTAILLTFTLFSTQTNSNNTIFTASRPSIAIINKDGSSKIVNNLEGYLKKTAKVKKFDEDKIDDALFYQDVDAVIYIYKGYSNDYLNNKEKKLDIKYSTGSSSSYAVMLLKQYFKISDICNDNISDEDVIIKTINKSLKNDTNVKIRSSLDTSSLSRVNYFYSFSNYSLLCICIYITSLLLLKFNQDKIRKRNIISSMKNSTINKQLFLGNLCFSVIVWAVLVGLSIFFNGKVMFTYNGLLYMLNSFVFMICALSIGFLIGNFVNNENAISALVNIIGLGSSFICGCFMPVQFLPDIVVKIAHFLPSYWYIKNNDLISSMEVFNFSNLKPLFINMGIVILFILLFMILNGIVTKKRRHIK